MFQPRRVLAEYVFAQLVRQGLLEFLGFGRVRIEIWRFDVGHPKHDPIGGLVALGAAEGVLRGMKDRVDHPAGNRRVRDAALERVGLFDFDAIGGGEGVERIAALELVEQVCRLRFQSRRDLIVTPVLLNLVLDLVESTVPCAA